MHCCVVSYGYQLIHLTFTSCHCLWTQAKTLYTNNIKRLYLVVSNLLNLRQGLTIPEFSDKMSSIKVKFNSMLPIGKSTAEELAQHDKFFIVCILAALGPDLGHVHNQLLSSSTAPTMKFILDSFVFLLFPQQQVSLLLRVLIWFLMLPMLPRENKEEIVGLIKGMGIVLSALIATSGAY